MISANRRKFLQTVGGAALAAPLISRYAHAAEFNYKYANNLPLDHAMNVRMKEAAERISADTNGRVAIAIFPSNQLGSDTDTLNQLRSGAVEFFTLSGLILSALVPVASINGMGFAFKDHDAVWKAMDGELGAHVRGAIDKSGLYAMEKIFNNGFRQITTSTKPITGPADLEGLKIRVPVSPLWTSMFKALGCAPTSINWNETYTALQTKVADAQENPLPTIAAGKIQEVQKYCSMTNHMWDGFWFLANRRAWNALPANIREICEKHINAAAVAEREDLVTLNVTIQKDLETKGLVFNTPPTDGIRDKLRTARFYEEWKGKYGDEAWALLEKYTGKLA